MSCITTIISSACLLLFILFLSEISYFLKKQKKNDFKVRINKTYSYPCIRDDNEKKVDK